MNDAPHPLTEGLHVLLASSQILVDALHASDADKAQEAITIMLMQGLDYFGASSELMQQFFPVFVTIKARIDAHHLLTALGQTELLRTQLDEVIALVRQQSN